MHLFFLIFQDWSLKVLRINSEDAGLYKCQANSHPPQFITVKLKVVGKYQRIYGWGKKRTLQLLRVTVAESRPVFFERQILFPNIATSVGVLFF